MPAFFDESFAVQMQGHGPCERHKCSTARAIVMTADLSTEVARMMKVCHVVSVACIIFSRAAEIRLAAEIQIAGAVAVL